MTSILLLALDLVGTFAFAISGTTAGGITRDALIEGTPSAALADRRPASPT